MFFWTVIHESLPTKALLHCRGMTLSHSCYSPISACMWRFLGYNSYTLTCGSKKVFVSQTLLFKWQAYGVFGKPGMSCILVMSRLTIINYGTMLGDILVLSRRPWVAVFSLARNNDGPPDTLLVWKLQFSMLMGAISIVPITQALEVFFAIRTVHDFVDSQNLLAFQMTCT
jgi:hypothetical protein